MSVDLAIVGNGIFGALVDGNGRYVWCCMDRFDGDPVFNCLINNNSDKTGFYDVVLEDFERSEQSYHGTSMVLVTRLHSREGDSIEIRDFAPRFTQFDRIFRPFQLFRTVRKLEGDPRMKIRLRPTFQYNSTDGYQTRGSQHVRYCGPAATWRVTTNTSIRHILEELPFLVPVTPVYIVFGTDESFTNSLPDVVNSFETKTLAYWRQWCHSLCLPVEFQEVLLRAAMTLAILQSEDSGGFIACLTVGLPLGPYGRATRDSRVCRLLDEALALPVLRDLGLLDVCRRFLAFAKEICFQSTPPQHTYNPSGSIQHHKRESVPYLAGYKGMGEVHMGGPLVADALEHAAAVAPSSTNWTAGATDTGSDGEAAGFSPEPWEGQKEWASHSVVYGLLVVSMAHAFFDVRLSKELCSGRLFEKLENYAKHACDGLGQMSQIYRSLGPGSLEASARVARPRPPSGAGFFDDNLLFLCCEDPPPENQAPPHGPAFPPVHSFSSALCWAAADRLQRIALHFMHDSEKAKYWERRAVELHEEISRYAWNAERGTFTTYWGGQRVSPSLLRLAEIGFIQPDDERFKSTLRAFEADAIHTSVSLYTNNGPTFRPVRPDPGTLQAMDPAAVLDCPSVCFTMNTLLWYCEALRSTGAPAKSRRLLESLVSCSTHRGILAESVDLRTSESWGNMPSASALLSLLRVVPRLSRSWREV